MPSGDEIILHHFDASPFAEKVRVALGLKQLTWRSVEIPLVMPKPNLTALTGGYRKTPVLQIGADVFCDTQRIAHELEARFAGPSLFPDGSQALCTALSRWSDAAFFQPGAGLSMGTNTGLPEDLLSDRAAFFSFMDFSSLDSQLPHLYGQYRAQLQLLEDMLQDGRSFLLGDSPSWADILAFFPLWMGRGNIGDTATLVQGLDALARWEVRMLGIGHGHRRPLPDTEALAIARDSVPAAVERIAADAWPRGLQAGAAVTVTPEDYGAVPVSGKLLRLTHREVALRRSDPLTGEVVVHFPRIGYRVEACA
jgi:glutathione S-transferase